jgi:predicted nucleic acid-binding protein
VIVVDSSVWIDNLRGRDTDHVRKLETIKNPQDIIVGDLILFEVLQGANNEGHASRLEYHLRKFEVVEMMSGALAPRVARNFRKLRALGVTIRKSTDLIIGTFCIEHGHSLLHADRDFLPMADHLGLQTL